MEKLQMLYSGKAKSVYSTADENLYIIEYGDMATAFNGTKRGSFNNKGMVNNLMSNIIFKHLENKGIKTHLVEELSTKSTLVKRVEIIPLEVIVRNVAAGSFSKRYMVMEGRVFKEPTVEFSYKNDELGDPLINDYQAIAMQLVTREEIDFIVKEAFKVNRVLQEFFLEVDLRLVDFKIEFGRLSDGSIVLADEISPDTCRLWDTHTNEKMDKDRFRQELGGFSEAYFSVLDRVMNRYAG